MLVSRDRQNVMHGAPKDFPSESVGAFLLKNLAEHGRKLLFIDSVTGEELYADTILQDAVTVAEYLRSVGVGVGSTVGFCSENRLEYPAPVVATLAVGATCAPLNPIYTNEEVIHTTTISQPSVIFCSPFTAGKILEVKQELPFIKTVVVFGEVDSDDDLTAYRDIVARKSNLATFLPAVIDPKNEVSVVLCSSGTTGLPKCVELTHFNLLTFMTALRDERIGSAQANDVVLGLIPFFHGYGYGMMLQGLSLGIKVIVMSMFNETVFLESIQNHKVTLLFAVPPLMVFLAKHPLVDEYDLSSIRYIGCGAAPLSKEVQLAVQKRLNITEIKQGYGMTETSVACCFMPQNKNKIGSSGVVAFGMECKVIDLETGKNLPPYKEGEICFRGPLIMKGYRENKKATDETIDKEGWLHTGDIGYYDIDNFLYIVDRLKELIKFKGFQVAPAELEAILLTNPVVKDAAVIGLPDEEAGELPLAFIVLQPDAKATEKEIVDFIASKVSAQKRLSGGVRFIDEIPKNPSGKILRRELRALLKSNLKSKL